MDFECSSTKLYKKACSRLLEFRGLWNLLKSVHPKWSAVRLRLHARFFSDGPLLGCLENLKYTMQKLRELQNIRPYTIRRSVWQTSLLTVRARLGLTSCFTACEAICEILESPAFTAQGFTYVIAGYTLCKSFSWFRFFQNDSGEGLVLQYPGTGVCPSMVDKW